MYIFAPCGENFHRVIIMKKSVYPIAFCGILTGAVAGLLGTGGGMVLVPLLTALNITDDDAVFPTSVSITLPICIVCLFFSYKTGNTDWSVALPCLIGSMIGGVVAGFIGKKIPTTWLHRSLGILILWGGLRYLC